jgi:haloalkane dehalogenase
MDILRTPDERFAGLPDYPFAPHYVEVDGLRIHYVDEGAADAALILMLHGEPSWSYLYRRMIPLFVAAGYRAVAPDLVGFGKSDKPAAREDYTYQRHLDWLWGWLEAVDLRAITLICQDWGSLLGLRLVAEHSERFARVVLTNGGLPTGDGEMPRAFAAWRLLSQRGPVLPVGRIVQMGCKTQLSHDVIRAYEAPFPDDRYKAGARVFPTLVPTRPDDPASAPNRMAWRSLMRFERPFLCAFSDGDPITAGGDAPFRRLVRGAQGQPHTTIEGAGHFVQEDKGEELARVVLGWLAGEGAAAG